MAITDQHSHVIAGMATAADEQAERERTRKVAERYRKEFIDLREQRIDPELFRAIPADLMFRYNFVPLEVQNNLLSIAVADPSQVLLSDELSLLLGKKLLIKVATPRQISDLLKRTEQSQRVLEQATEAFTLQIGKDEVESDETISGDRLTRDSTASPVVRLVETIIFTALERRASDIHIEARDAEVAVKYRIDGVLQHAMQPIAKEWHSTVLSRIKVLSDLDIAERRVPQDGRFRVKYKGRFIDLRVSIMPASHGEDAVLRVLDKETLSEKFQSLSLDVVGFSGDEMKKFRRYIREPYGMVLVTGPTGSGKTTTLYAAINEIKSDEDKIITIEDPGRISVARHHADSREREKGADLRARVAFDFAPRPRQDHGRRNPRPGNRADRHSVRADRTPGFHHRSRQQRYRRYRPLHQHGRRAVQFRFGAELHHGPASGARRLRQLQAAAPLHLRGASGSRPGSGRVAGRACRRRRMPGMLGHRLSWTNRHLRTAGSYRPNSRNDRGSPADFRNQACGARRRHDHVCVKAAWPKFARASPA